MIPALLDHLLQSTLFAGAVALIALALRNSTASLRFWLWLAASLKFLIPFAVLTAIGEGLAPAVDAGPELRTLSEAAERFPELMPDGPLVKMDMTPVFDPGPWLLGLWIAGVVMILGVRLVRWHRLRAVLSASRPLPSIGRVPVRVSVSALEPGLIGIRRPVVLLPEDLSKTLEPNEIDAILAHETAHFRRRDNLWATLHMAVEVLFWFHPMVWWIGNRLIAERERACDDAVVQHGHPRAVYARAILETCRTYLRSPLACVSGASGANLADRIEAIMTAPGPGRVTPQQTAALFSLVALIVAIPVASGLIAPAADRAPDALMARSWASDLFEAGPTPAQVAHDLADQKRPRTAIPFDPSRFDAYVGDYQTGPYAIMTVTRHGNRYFSQITGQKPVEIFPENNTKFFSRINASQFSFSTGIGRRPNAVILHQGGFNRRYPRLDPATAAELRKRLARRIADNRPSPGTEAYARQWLTVAATGRLDLSQMTPRLAHAVRAQWRQDPAFLASLGPFKAIRFLGVSPQGADLYEVDFQNRRVFTRLEPLVDGKAYTQFLREMH